MQTTRLGSQDNGASGERNYYRKVDSTETYNGQVVWSRYQSFTSSFYADCRVLPLGEEAIAPIHSARAALCAATMQVIANGLDLLGVSAPERM